MSKGSLSFKLGISRKIPINFLFFFVFLQLLEMLCEEYGGRVVLAKAYYKALTASVRKHFKGNGVIASMEHCNDFMFLGTESVALGRVGMLLIYLPKKIPK